MSKRQRISISIDDAVVNVKRFDSWSDFVHAVSQADVVGAESASTSWAGLDYETALEYAKTGDERLVERAQALLDKLESVEDGIPTRQWSASPYGAYPCVPDYLAGMPDCMRTIAPTGDIAPIGIYCSTTSSGCIDTISMQKRGTAILALVLKLQQIRPVELYLTAELGSYDCSSFEIIPIDSKPLSLAHACYALTSAGFARQLTYSYARAKLGSTGRWPIGFTYGYESATYERCFREACGLSGDDMHIGAIHAHDALLADPIKWVNQQIVRYSALQD